MTFVVSILGVKPHPRYDSKPYVTARIEEASEVVGPYTAIQTLDVQPVDTDPSEPSVRNFTTTQALLSVGWYRVVFIDASLAEDPTDPQLLPLDAVTRDISPWFTLDNLKAEYPQYTKLQQVSAPFANGTVIPEAQRFVSNYVRGTWKSEDLPTLVAIAKRYAVNRLLADDETIAIMRARGQSSIQVAGETITLDLTSGTNFWISPADKEVLDVLRGGDLSDIHTDKIQVRGDYLYTQASGHDEVEFIRDDGLPRAWGSDGTGGGGL